jgi:predicted RNase H-like HicB family nuclease
MTIKVVFEPNGGGWRVHVPSLPGCRTWGRCLAVARRNIREALRVHEVGFAAARAVFDEDIRLPTEARAVIRKYAAAKAKAETEATKVKAASTRAARTLTEADLSLRDAGELLGLSREGVRKLLKAS